LPPGAKYIIFNYYKQRLALKGNRPTFKGSCLTALHLRATISQLLHLGATLLQLLHLGVAVLQLLHLRAAISQLLHLGATVLQLLHLGVTVSQLLHLGATVSQLLHLGAAVLHLGASESRQYYHASPLINRTFRSSTLQPTHPQFLKPDITNMKRRKLPT